MEREDPLERIAREEREKSARHAGGNNLKTVMIVLAAVSAVLAVALIITGVRFKTTSGENTKYSELVAQLNEEKADLTKQIETLQNDFADLSSDYDSINLQLDASRAQIDELVTSIRKTDATNRRQMRKYQSELGTLRGIMRGYINQIDSLNTLNHKLTEQAQEAREEAASAKRKNEKLTAKVEDLSSQVAVGSVLKARGLNLVAHMANDKETNKAGRAKRLLASLSLVENELAPRGTVRVYVRVLAPDGSLLGNGVNFTIGEETLQSTASREVDYEGEEVDISIYVNNIPSFSKGTYTMEAYTLSGKLGSAALTLN